MHACWPHPQKLLALSPCPLHSSRARHLRTHTCSGTSVSVCSGQKVCHDPLLCNSQCNWQAKTKLQARFVLPPQHLHGQHSAWAAQFGASCYALLAAFMGVRAARRVYEVCQSVLGAACLPGQLWWGDTDKACNLMSDCQPHRHARKYTRHQFVRQASGSLWNIKAGAHNRATAAYSCYLLISERKEKTTLLGLVQKKLISVPLRPIPAGIPTYTPHTGANACLACACHSTDLILLAFLNGCCCWSAGKAPTARY